MLMLQLRPMKQRSTTPVSRRQFTKRLAFGAIAAVMAVVAPLQFLATDNVSADKYDDQIRALEREIEQYQDKAAKLNAEGDTLQLKLDALNNEKARLQAKIDLNEAKHDKLQKEIEENKKRIEANREALGSTLADLYVDGDITPLEMLASSGTLGDYLDKQERLSSVRDTLKSTIDEINQIQADLEDKQEQVKKVLADQQNQRADLASKAAEQNRLVRQTRGKEAAYQELSSEAQKKKDQVQREQQAAIEAALRAAGAGGNAVAGDPNKGGYPSNLANSDYYNPIVDPWGMYSRQCVSYTAWKVFQKNGYMPYWGGVGNANQWDDNARAAGITVSSTPKAGSVGVINAGAYGHTVWVESVNSDGTINISQYNYFNAGGPGWGHYSEMYNVSPAAYDAYIYF